MIRLSEMIDESDASEEAKRLGLTHMGWGRYGKDRKVTHISKNGKLVPADQKVGEPHPAHGAAVRNVTRGRPAGEMPEPEYPVKYKQGAQTTSPVGQPSTPEDPNANLRATPLKKVAAGDYGDMEPKPKTPDVNKLSSMMPTSSRSKVAVDAINSYTGAKDKLDAAQRALDRVPEDNPSLYDRAEQVFFAASDAFNKSKDQASQNIDDFEWGEQHSSEEEINAARLLADIGYDYLTGEDNQEQTDMLNSALDDLRYRIEDYDMSLDDDMPDKLDDVVVAAMDVAEIRSLINQGRGATNYPGSSREKRNMMPNRTPDQLKDPEDFAKNRQF